MTQEQWTGLLAYGPLGPMSGNGKTARHLGPLHTPCQHGPGHGRNWHTEQPGLGTSSLPSLQGAYRQVTDKRREWT